MATVPRGKRSSEGVGVIPGGKVSEDVPLADDFEEPLNLAEKMAQDMYDEEKEAADNNVLHEARRALNDLESRVKTDENTGTEFQFGKDAFGMRESMDTQLDEFANPYMESLADDGQREAVKNLVESRREQWVNYSDGRVATEREKYEKDEFEANVGSMQDRAHRDPATAPVEREMIKNLLDDRADRTGIGKAEADEVRQEQLTILHKGVVETMLSKDQDEAANEYFDNIPEEELDPKVADEIRKSLKEESLRGESQRRSEEIYSKGQTEAEAVAQARKIEDPELQDMTVARVKKLYVEEAAREKEAHDQAYIEAGEAIDQNPHLEARDAVPPEVWHTLTPSEKKTLESRAEGLQDDSAWGDLFWMSDEDRNALSRKEYEEIRSKLDPSYQTKADTMMKASAAKTGGGKKSNKMDNLLTYQAQVKNTWDALEQKEGESDKAKRAYAADFAMFEAEGASRVEAEQAKLNRLLTGDETRAILEDMAAETVTVEKGFWKTDTDVVSATMTAVEREETYLKGFVDYKKIPAQPKDKIRALLKQEGIPVTNATVEELFNAERVFDRERFLEVLGRGK